VRWGLRDQRTLNTLKKDTNKEYDVAFGEYYRENHTIKSIIPAEKIAGNRQLNNLMELIIEEAIDRGAMNIDISLDSAGYGIVELRIGKKMVADRLLDKDAVYGLSIVCRRMAGVDYENEFKSNISGNIRYEYKEYKYDLRCAFINTAQGLSMSLRILKPATQLEDIGMLGFPDNVETAFRESLKANQGLILVTGATSSGKTTTQYAGIHTVINEFEHSKNIRTVEDPVEYTVSGVKQSPVNEESGETFSKILQAILRGDPDVILVGEINDAETAKTAIRAATSGHLVMSTLHTNNTIEVTRVMQQYGANYIDLGNALQLVLNQELEDRLCDTCRVERAVTSSENNWIQKRLGVNDIITVLSEAGGEVDGKKCPDCEGLGYRGSTLIVEMLEADYVYQRALNKAKDNTFLLEQELLEDPDANFYPIGRDVFRHLKDGRIDFNTARRIMKKQTGEGVNEINKRNEGE